MKTFVWKQLEDLERVAKLARPAVEDAAELRQSVRAVLERVRAEGDSAVRDLTREFDDVGLDDARVTPVEFAAASDSLTTGQCESLERAVETVSTWHGAQRADTVRVETAAGVVCEQLCVPIDSVGLYVPSGSAPLPSAVIMMGVPSRIAGCPRRVLTTPPRADGTADPAVLVAARLCGIDTVFKIGGAQAIAAMAYGTETVPKVDKLFGPGNRWVTEAKVQVAADPGGAAIDLPAGPSEVLVIADTHAAPEFVAADLLAQAEHGPDSQVVLVTPDASLAARVTREIERQLGTLSRADITGKALGHARIVIVEDLAEALDVSNRYAPEHLILNVKNPRDWLPGVRNAGSVFLGPWAPETVGDYCSGTNHVLPTYGYARSYSGLGLADFQKTISVQELTAEGLADIGPVAQTIAGLEGLDAHANAVTVRLDALAKRCAS